MSKRCKRKSTANFSVDSLREEVNEEFNQEAIANKLFEDIRHINLKFVDHVSVDVILYAILVKLSFSFVCALTYVACSLFVLPANVCCEVLKYLHPDLPENDTETIFECILKLKLPNISVADQVHVFTPPCGRCLNCNLVLVRHNDPVNIL